MALRCVERDRTKRPTIMEVIDKLNEIETSKLSLVAQVFFFSPELFPINLLTIYISLAKAVVGQTP